MKICQRIMNQAVFLLLISIAINNSVFASPAPSAEPGPSASADFEAQHVTNKEEEPQFVVITDDVIPDVVENSTRKVIRVNPLELPRINDDPTGSEDSSLYKIQSFLPAHRNYVNSNRMRKQKQQRARGRSTGDSTIIRGDSPITRADSPITRADSPITRAESPITRAESPITRAESPITRADLPITRADLPITRADLPIARADSPVVPYDSPIHRYLPEESKLHKPKDFQHQKKKHLHFLYKQEALDGRVVGKSMRVHVAPGAYPVYYAVSKTNGRFGKFPIKGFRNEADFMKYLLKSKLHPIDLAKRLDS